MDFPAVREELLAQHTQLIELAGIARGLARRLLAGDFVEVELLEAVAALDATFAAHNARELSALAPLLARVEGTGPRLVRRMVDEHIEEHGLFRKGLKGPPLEVALRLDELCELMIAHMMAEERTFLSVAALRGAAESDR